MFYVAGIYEIPESLQGTSIIGIRYTILFPDNPDNALVLLGLCMRKMVDQ